MDIPSPLTLCEALSRAAEAAEAGWHFEEGGCFGFAESLYRRFLADGRSPYLRYRAAGFTHAWVVVDGIAYDHQGVIHNPAREARDLPDLLALAEVAALNGTDGEAYDCDVAWADQIVNNAWALMTPTQIP